MNKRERVNSALTGKTVDRVPVSAWCHFFEKEINMDSFVKSMLEFQQYYDWDYMKIHPRYSYHLEDWGSVYTQSGKPGDWPVCEKYPIKNADDWGKLKVLKPDQGSFGAMLKAVEQIKKGLKDEVPFIMTVFSPLMIANHLCGFILGTNDLKKYIENDLDNLNKGLDTIAETFVLFVEALRKIGVDGLFFATKEANDDFIGAGQYQAIARRYDERVLTAAKGFPFNMLHICGDRIHFKEMADYPVTMVHWDSSTGNNPDYKAGRNIIGDRLAFGGGPNRNLMVSGSPVQIKQEIKKVLTDTEGKHFLLGPACSILINQTSEENMWLLRKGPEQFQDY